MKRHMFMRVVVLLVLASLALTACGTPTTVVPPVATDAPVVTEAPVVEPAAFEPLVVSAADCNYGTADNPAKLLKIEAVDEFTVKFTLCAPDPAFPSKVAFSVFSIADQASLEAQGGDSIKMSDNSNGTGPYVLKEWVRGDHITFEANPNYWGEKAKVQTLIFRWSEQSAQRLLELQSGTVDGIDNPAPEDFDTITGDANLALYPRAAGNIFYVGFNNAMAPFDKVEVRKAFAMAIDRQRIVEQYYPAGSAVAINFVPDFFNPGFSPSIPWYDYDPVAAKALLDSVGFDYTQEITLSIRNVVRSYLPTPDKVAQEIQAQLAEIGLNVKIEVMESAAFIDATSAGQRAFYLLGWGMDYPDSTNFFDYHFANASNLQFGALFQDMVDEINAAAKLSDVAARQSHYDTVNQMLKDYVPMIPVAHGGSATAFKANVTGAHASPLGNEIFAVMDNGADTLVWMQNGEPAALWCTDETDGETLRACEQVYEPLLAFEVGGAAVVPGLAEKFESNADLTEWTFTLRPGVAFHNGATLDANDVVATYASIWDAKNPAHKGRTTTFEYFTTFFGAFLNAE